MLLLMILLFNGDFNMSQTINNGKFETVCITVIYDNNPYLKNLQIDWGFACLVDIGKTRILFDTGDKADILLRNMKKLDIDPQTIDFVFLSHFHHDHTGGLEEFLKTNSSVKVFYPQSFPFELIDLIKNSGAASFPVSYSKEISRNVFTLGEIDGTVSEQSLAVRSSKGIVVISGCAHPGIVNILEKAKKEFPGELIYLAMGGFHLEPFKKEEIREIVDKIYDMEILCVAPTHCSGSTARKLFQEVFNADYIETGAGKVIKIE